MLGTTAIPDSEILDYCNFPPQWGVHLGDNNPYAGIHARVNHEGGFTYDIPNELLLQHQALTNENNQEGK